MLTKVTEGLVWGNVQVQRIFVLEWCVLKHNIYLLCPYFAKNIFGWFLTGYLQLKHVRIRINHRLDFKSLDLQDLIRVGSQDLASLELIIENDRCDIAANGHPFATLNTKTHLALHSASSAAMLRYTGLVPYLELCQKLTSAGKRTGSNVSAQDYAISILIYGHRSVGKSLAKTLSRYHLFLQHPMVMPVDVVYENPQYLSMVGSSFANGAVLPPISAESLKDDADRSDERLDEYDSVDLATTLDNLPKHHCLPQADIDPRIRTTLLRLGHNT
jgi:hypothetical protein